MGLNKLKLQRNSNIWERFKVTNIHKEIKEKKLCSSQSMLLQSTITTLKLCNDRLYSFITSFRNTMRMSHLEITNSSWAYIHQFQNLRRKLCNCYLIKVTFKKSRHVAVIYNCYIKAAHWQIIFCYYVLVVVAVVIVVVITTAIVVVVVVVCYYYNTTTTNHYYYYYTLAMTATTPT